jgi:hypothetical protein
MHPVELIEPTTNAFEPVYQEWKELLDLQLSVVKEKQL